MKRLAAILLACMLCMCNAATASEMPYEQFFCWLTEAPTLHADVQVDLSTIMPYDDVRTAELNALMKHVRFAVDRSVSDRRTEMRLGAAVDGEEAVWCAINDSEEKHTLQLSVKPDTVYSSAVEAPLSLIFGQNDAFEQTMTWMTELNWLDQAYSLVEKVSTSFDDYATLQSIKTQIGKVGNAVSKQSITIPADMVQLIHDRLFTYVTDGQLTNFLASMTYTGKQSFLFYRNEEGSLLKVVYNGQCGTDAESMRNVSLEWRLRRSDDVVMDDLTLRTPTVSGNARYNVIFTRDQRVDDTGATSLTASYKRESVERKKKSTVSGSASLQTVPTDNGFTLQGKVSAKHTPSDADESVTVSLMPDLTLDIKHRTAAGTLGIEEKTAKEVTASLTMMLSLSEAVGPMMPIADRTVALDSLTQEETDTIRSWLASSITSRMVRRLVLVGREDAGFFARDMDESAWAEIEQAARNALKEEKQ